MDYDTSAYDWSGLPIFCLTSRSLKWAVRGAGKQGKHVQITRSDLCVAKIWVTSSGKFTENSEETSDLLLFLHLLHLSYG